MHRCQIQNFSTYREGRLTSNLGHRNVGSVIFCIAGLLINIFCFTKKCFYDGKTKFKKSFFSKEFYTERKFLFPSMLAGIKWLFYDYNIFRSGAPL